jgi:hypothetical protein
MKNKIFFVVGLIIAFAFLFEFAAFAQTADLATKITFGQPIQVPGQVLPAGTYLFTLGNSGDNLNLVQIFNADRTHLYATLQTITAQREQPTDDTALVLAKSQDGGPDVLLKWFYPGNDSGNEFVYPRQEAKNLAQDKQATIVANGHAASIAGSASAGD